MRCSLNIAVTLVSALATFGAEQKISKKELGNAWPFTVDEGGLACEGSKGFGAVTFQAKGVTYAVNGTAMSRRRGVDIDRIWASDPSGLVPKKNIGAVIERGLKLCK